MRQPDTLAHVIRAIGDPDFAAVAAQCALDCAQFELAAVIVHRRRTQPVLLYDNFAAADGEEGIHNYVSVTHTINPILRRATNGASVFRARDFRKHGVHAGTKVEPYLVRCAEEELGFRTLGWPEKLEEIGLYFCAAGGIVELSLYRERGEHAAGRAVLDRLRALGAPLAAAFDSHARFPQAVAAEDRDRGVLTPREAQIVGLLLLGCGSEAISLRLNISRYTVKDHRKQIFRKLGVGSLAELFALHRKHASDVPAIVPPREGL